MLGKCLQECSMRGMDELLDIPNSKKHANAKRGDENVVSCCSPRVQWIPKSFI